MKLPPRPQHVLRPGQSRRRLLRGKIFVGTLDNRLVALDAETGKAVWTRAVASQEDDYTITGAPRVVKGKVIIGNGGAEFGVRGFVAAYDPAGGKQVWRFYIVPGDPTSAVREQSAWKRPRKPGTARAGSMAAVAPPGTAWPTTPSSTCSTSAPATARPGPRTFAAPAAATTCTSARILALRPDTGEYVWHYQETPKDNWDYASTQPLVLTDLTIQGRRRKVILHAPKNGFFYVVDRATGNSFPPKPFAKVTWALGVDPKTGRPDRDSRSRLRRKAPRFHRAPTARTTGTRWRGIRWPV